LKNYVGCQLIEDIDNNQMWITQPKLVNNMEETFGSQLTGRFVHVPGAAPKTGVVRPQEGETVIDSEQQSMFRTRVGMLLDLTKHSRPEICNAVRELTKVLGKATPGHYKMMIRIKKYIMDTKDFGLHIKPVKNERLF